MIGQSPEKHNDNRYIYALARLYRWYSAKLQPHFLTIIINHNRPGFLRAGYRSATAAGHFLEPFRGLLRAIEFDAIIHYSSTTIAAWIEADPRVAYVDCEELVSSLAPGVNVLWAWNDGTIHTISGTSMASPHDEDFLDANGL